MMLFKRRVKEGYDNFYGNIPKFLGKPEDIDQLGEDSKVRFGMFLNVAFKYMLIFGRLEDSLQFYASMEKTIEKLPLIQQHALVYKKKLMDDVREEFGAKNRTVLVGLFKELLLTDKEDRQDASLNYEQSLATTYNAFANAHIQLGDMEKGVNFLSAAADTDKKNITLQIQVADHFYRMKALGPAIKHYERAISLEPGRVHECNKLGVLYYQKGQIKEAEEYFQKAVEADPKVIESYINLGAIFMAQGKNQQAREINKKGLLVDPENVDLLGMKKDIGY